MTENARFCLTGMVIGFIVACICYAIYDSVMGRVEVALMRAAQGEFISTTHVDLKEKGGESL